MSWINRVITNLKNPKKPAGDLSYQSEGWRQLHYRGNYFATRITKKPSDVKLTWMKRQMPRYQGVVDSFNEKYGTRLHWMDLAIIHALEGDSDFSTVLHNGETLVNVNKYGTRLEPKGLGKDLNWTWDQAALNALEFEYKKGKLFPKSMKIEEHLFFLEQYNGLGYLKFHTNCLSPYLWSYTNKYEKGKYASDGQWNENLTSQQCGAVAYYQLLGDPLI